VSVVSQVFSDEGKKVCPLDTRSLVDRILLFIDALAEVRLYTYQSLFARRVVEDVVDNGGSTITGLWARQSGKTESVADIVIGLCVILPELARQFPDDVRLKPFWKGFWAGVYAPVQDQAQISFGRMREKVNSDNGQEILNDEELNVQIIGNRSDSLSFSNGSYVYSRTASPDSQIEGKTYHLVICEEAQKLLPTKVEKEIRPMLKATNGSMVMIGTAWESRGGFHRTIQHNLDIHTKGGPRNHFEFPYDIVLSEKVRAYEIDGNPFHLFYGKSLANDITRLGGEAEARRNPEFQMNYMCLWRESRVIAVREDVFLRAGLKNVEMGRRRGGLVQVAGLDIGKIIDSTVLTVGEIDMSNPIRNPYVLPEADLDKQNYYSKTIIDWLEMDGAFEGYTGQYRRLIEYLQDTNVQILVVDATSIGGDVVFERIEAMVGDTIMCVPFKFSSMSKALLYKYYLQEIHSGRLHYASGPETQKTQEWQKFQHENLNLDRVEVGGYAVCQAPDGEHDDYPDSAALMCWGEKLMEELFMPDISVSSASGHDGRASGREESMRTEGQVDLTASHGGNRGGRYARRW
jgi:hypothetical protein